MKKKNKYSDSPHERKYNEKLHITLSFADAVKVCVGAKPVEDGMIEQPKEKVKRSYSKRKRPSK